ncbi:MAG: Hsp20/alpha crystallin family protein [Candidatus Zixiibacteriota bacterium]|nr:MAG: Hsp20/alpha crystallin family protein [candidate division Zixibacteria bacterium]
MTLVRYNPNRLMAGVARDFDGLIDSFFKAPVFRSNCDCDFMPRVDIVEDKDNIRLQFELPGMEKDEIKVVVEDGVLTVSGERKQESEEKENSFIRTERVYGSFSRSFTFPEDVDSEKVSADYKNGLLNITLAKTEKARPKEITVNIK